MKLYLYRYGSRYHIGFERDGELVSLRSTDRLASHADMMRTAIEDEASTPGALILSAGMANRGVLMSEVSIAAPLRRPGKIICVGRNYAEHAKEGAAEIPDRPMLFSKFSTAVLDPGAPIVKPIETEALDYEGELAVVIGKRGRRVSEANAYDYVFGYTIMNDVTARDIQYGDKQWLRGKSFDTFAPMGPCITTADEIDDPHQLTIETRVNGAIRQSAHTGSMIFKIPQLIAFASNAFTLEPGDIISTGTPEGVGYFMEPKGLLQAGDRVQIQIEKLGVLENPVVAETIAP